MKTQENTKKIIVTIAIITLVAVIGAMFFGKGMTNLKSQLQQSHSEDLNVTNQLQYLDDNGEIVSTTATMVAGSDYSVALSQDGRVWVWGNNDNGQLGIGSTSSKSTPVRVRTSSSEYLASVIHVAVGENFGVAVTAFGNVYAWGVNTDGQLGLGDTNDRLYATKIEGLEGIENVACGRNHTLLLKKDGTVLAFGGNESGQLGIGSNTNSTTPVSMPGISGAAKVTAGNGFSLVLGADGKVYSTGKNTSGQLGIGSTTASTSVKNVKTGASTTLTDIIDISAGDSHVIALDSSGYVYTWGNNTYGQLGTGDNSNRTYAEIVTMNTQTIGCIANTSYIAEWVDPGDGNYICVLFATGLGTSGQIGNNEYGNVNTWTMIEDAGKNYFNVYMDSFENSCVSNTIYGIAYTGEVYGWGVNDSNNKLLFKNAEQYSTPMKLGINGERYRTFTMKLEETSDFPVSRADYSSTFNLYYIQPTEGVGQFYAEEAGETQYSVGCGNGAVIESYIKVNDYNDKTATGENHTLALKDDGTVWAWGDNTYGQLGIGSNVDSREPVQVKIDETTYLTDVINIAAGKNYSAAVTTDGKLYTWGYNNKGQLCTQDTTDRNYATQVTIGGEVADVACGEDHTIVLLKNGTVYACGDNSCGQLGDATMSEEAVLTPVMMEKASYVSKVFAGEDVSVVVKASGDILACGKNECGQLGNGTFDNSAELLPVMYDEVTSIGGIVNVAMGQNHIAAVDTQGYTFIWGDNTYGQLLLPLEYTCYPYANIGADGTKDVGTLANTTYIVGTDNTIYAFGLGTEGQIGNNASNTSTEPVLVENEAGMPFDIEIRKITGASFSNTAYVVTKYGEVYAWGENGSKNKIFQKESDIYNYAVCLGYTQASSKKVMLKPEETKTISFERDNVISDFTLFDDDTEFSITYYIEDETIATIDQTGLITGVSEGKTKGIATCYNGKIININVIVMTDIAKVASAKNNVLVLKSDGTVWAWGDNTYGQLGNGTNTTESTPTQVKISEDEFLTNILDVSASEKSMAAVDKNGELYTWGYNNYGQLGLGDKTNRKYATLNEEISGLVSVSCGLNHTIVLTEEGTVYGCGYNKNGQLGNGTKTDTTTWVRSNVTNVDKIGVGLNFSIMLKANGTVYGCGYNNYGQLGNGLTTESNVPVQVKIDGSTNLTGIEDIAVGENFVVAKANDKNAYAWGYNGYGQLGIGNTETKKYATKCGENIKLIGTSANTSYLIDEDNLVYASGLGTSGQLGNYTNVNSTTYTIVQNVDNENFDLLVDSISSSNSSNTEYVVTAEGEVYGWGVNSSNYKLLLKNINTYDCAVKLGTGGEKFKQIIVREGQSKNFNIETSDWMSDFRIYQVAENVTYTYSSDDTSVANISQQGLVVGMKKGITTGKVTCSNGEEIQLRINVAEHIVKVESGTNFSVMLKDDGTIWSWGYNNYGQLGIGTTITTAETSQVKIDEDIYLTNIVDIAVGPNFVAAVTKDGDLYTWGYNGYGQLGDGTNARKTYATKVNGIQGAVAVACGQNYTTVLLENGLVYGFGYNGYGQLGNGNTSTSYTPVLMEKTSKIIDIENENNSSIVLRNNGCVSSCGYNSYGELGRGNTSTQTVLGTVVKSNGTPLKKITKIEAGADICLAINNDGYVYGWGYNNYGQLGTGTQTGSNYTVNTAIDISIQGSDIAMGANTAYITTFDGRVYASGLGTTGEIGNNESSTVRQFTLVQNDDGSILQLSIDEIFSGTSSNTAYLVDSNGDLYGWGKNTSAYSLLRVPGNELFNYAINIGERNISLNLCYVGLEAGETQTLVVSKGHFNLYGKTSSGGGNISNYEWHTMDENVATVSNGTITAVGRGDTKIYVESDVLSDILECRVVVNDSTGKVSPMATQTGTKATIVLKEDGSVWATGSNEYGELAQGTNTLSSQMLRVKTAEDVYLQNVIKIAAGNSHVVALTRDGHVYTWGYNGYGQLGQGDTTNRLYATKIEGLSNIVDIAAGANHTVVLNNLGDSYSCGYNYYGQLANGNSSQQNTMTPALLNFKLIQVTASESSTMFINNYGRIKTAGYNGYGQLGGTNLQKVADIQMIGSTSTAIDVERKGYVWGDNSYGQLGNRGTSSSSTPMAAGCYVTETINVVNEQTGEEEQQQVENFVEFQNVKQTGGSKGTVMIQLMDNTVYVSGRNNNGQFGKGNLTNIKEFEALKSKQGTARNDVYAVSNNGNSEGNTLFIAQNGNVYISGTNAKGEMGNGTQIPTKIYTKVGGDNSIIIEETQLVLRLEETKNISTVQNTNYFNVFIDEEGTGIEDAPKTWATNNAQVATVTQQGIVEAVSIGETTISVKVGDEISIVRVQVISEDKRNITIPSVNVTGTNTTISLKTDGSVWGLGNNRYGELAQGNSKISNKVVRIKTSSEVFLKRVKKVAVGNDYILALTNTGEVYAWGNNSYGQLGLGDTKTRFYATKISTLSNIIDIAAGDSHSVALTATGKVFTWGRNNYGQLALGNTTNKTTPQEVNMIVNVADIEAGYYNTIILGKEGQIYVAGENKYGQLGNGTETNQSTFDKVLDTSGVDYLRDVVEVNSNGKTMTALNVNGHAFAWGDNSYGQLGIASATKKYHLPQGLKDSEGTSISNIVSLGGNGTSISLLKSDKMVLVAGQNNYGQLGIGTSENSEVFAVAKDEVGDLPNTLVLGKLSNNSVNNATIKADGTVWTVGENSSCQLGDETQNNSKVYIKFAEGFLNYPEKVLTLRPGEYYDVQKDLFNYEEDFNVYGKGEVILGTLVYTSSNPDVITATVTEGGRIRARGEGFARVIIEDVFARVKTSILVKVSNNEEIKIESGSNFTLALDNRANVYSWGYNYYAGRTGQGSSGLYSYVNKPTQIKELKNIMDIGAGANHAIALDKNGFVYTWGQRYYGALGDGVSTYSSYACVNKPQKLEYLIGEGIVDVDAYKNISVALSEDGRVWAWGQGYGNIPTEIQFSQPIIAISGNLVLGENRRVYTLDDTQCEFGYGKDIVKISAGQNHNLALSANGEVYSWGNNSYGQLGNGLTSSIACTVKVAKVGGEEGFLQDIFEVKAGLNYSVVMDSNKNVYSFGSNASNQLMLNNVSNSSLPIMVQNATDTEVISASEAGNFTIISNWAGMVYSCGYNYWGELGLGYNGYTSRDGSANKTSLTLVGEMDLSSADERIELETGETKDVHINLNKVFLLKKEDEEGVELNPVDTSVGTAEDLTVTAVSAGRTLVVVRYQNAYLKTIELEVLEKNATAVEDINSGNDFTIALKNDGTIWSFGDNKFGQLGLGGYESKNIPTKIALNECVKEIAVGDTFAVALTSEGKVYAWGESKNGQTGTGTTANVLRPTKVINSYNRELSNIVAVRASKNVGYAIAMDGTVYGFGEGYGARAIVANRGRQTVDLTKGYTLSDNGRVTDASGARITTQELIKNIEEGKDHLVMLSKEKNVFTLGKNESGQLGDGTYNNSSIARPVVKQNGTPLEKVRSISAGDEYTLAVSVNGVIYTAGDNINGVFGKENTEVLLSNTFIENTQIPNAVRVTAGSNHMVAENYRGVLYASGKGNNGQLGNIKYEDSAIPVMVGGSSMNLDNNSVVIPKGTEKIIKGKVEVFNVKNKENKELVFDVKDSNVASVQMLTGENLTGLLTQDEIKNGYKAIKVTGNDIGTTMGKFTNYENSAIEILQIEVIKEGTEIAPMISTNGNHAIALMSDGTVWAWGDNTYGQLGNGTTTSSDEPVKVAFSPSKKIVQISAGEYHNVALDSDGNVYTWGYNSCYQLGRTGDNLTIPTQVSGIPKARSVVASSDATTIITTTNEIYGWGKNIYGQLGIGSYNEKVLPTKANKVERVLDVVGGKTGFIILNELGEVYAAGSNKYGQLASIVETNKFTKIDVNELIAYISSGDYSTGLISIDGNVYMCGKNNEGTLGTGDIVNKKAVTKIQNLNNIRGIDIGTNHSIIKDNEGKIYLTGGNECGQLGNGTETRNTTFTQNSQLSDIYKISAGNTYTVVCNKQGEVYAWGDYRHGSDEKYSMTDSKVPVKLSRGAATINDNEVSIIVGQSENIKINPQFDFNLIESTYVENQIEATSLNTQIAQVGTVNKDSVQVNAIKEGTTIIEILDANNNEKNRIIVKVLPSDSSTKIIPKVEGGENFTMALKNDGTVWTWGKDAYGIANSDKPVQILSEAKDIAVGKDFALILKQDGKVISIGNNTQDQLGEENANGLTEIENLENIEKIYAGTNFAVVKNSKGVLYGWGVNANGQLGLENTVVKQPTKLEIEPREILQVSAGEGQIIVLTKDGRVYGKGQKYNGYISGLEHIVKAELGTGYILVMKEDGTVYKYENGVQTQQGEEANATDINTRNNICLYTTVDEMAYMWGTNTNGQLGVNNKTDMAIPTAVNENGQNVFDIGIGYNNSYIIVNDGYVYSAGSNENGLLGNQTSKLTAHPTYQESLVHVLVGNKDFDVIPEIGVIEEGSTEELDIGTEKFNMYRKINEQDASYTLTSDDEEIVSVQDDLSIKGESLGSTNVDVKNNETNQVKRIERNVVPIGQDRISSLKVNSTEASRIDAYNYEVGIVVDEDATEAPIEITTKENDDKISIDGGNTWAKNGILNQSINVENRESTVNITVENNNGIQVQYTLKVFRKDRNNNLLSLKVNEVDAKLLEDGTYEMVVEPNTEATIIATVGEYAKLNIVEGNEDVELTAETATAVKQIAEKENTIYVNVTAESGEKKTYTLKIYTTECFLEIGEIVVDGKNAVKVDGTEDNYEVTIEDYDLAEVEASTKISTNEIRIDNNEKAEGKATASVETIEPSNNVVITTYAQKEVQGVLQEISKQYTLTINKKMEYSKLQDIVVNEMLEENNLEVTEVEPRVYEVNLQNPVNTISVTATAKYSTAQISIENNELEAASSTRQIAVVRDGQEITIEVNGQDGSTKVYTLIVNTLSTDNEIGTITVGESNVAVYNELLDRYEVRELNAESYSVTATSADQNAKVKIGEGIDVGQLTQTVADTDDETIVTITIIAQNGIDAKDYTLAIIPKSTNANLSGIKIISTEGTTDVEKDKETGEYQAMVGNKLEQIEICAITEDTRATVEINGTTGVNTASFTKELTTTEDLVYNITVTAEDGIATTTEIFNLSVRDSNTNIASISVNDKPVVDYNEETKTYYYSITQEELEIGEGKASITVATENTETTYISINGEEPTIGTKSTSQDIINEETNVGIVVRAEDGSMEEYQLVISTISNDTSYKTLEIKENNEVVAYEVKDDETFEVRVSENSDSIGVKIIPTSTKAQVKIEEGVYSPQLDTTVDISDVDSFTFTIMAEDGTQKEYTVNIVKVISSGLERVTVNGELATEEEGTYKISIDRNAQISNIEIKGKGLRTQIELLKEETSIQTGTGTLTVNQTITEDTTYTIKTTGTDETNTYILEVTRKERDTTLQYVKLNTNSLTAEGNTYYSDNAIENNAIEVKANGNYAKVKIDGGEYANGQIMEEFNLQPNESKLLNVTVEAENGNQATYILNIRRKNNNTEIQDIIINDLESVESNETFTNTQFSTNENSSIKVVPEDINSTVTLRNQEGIIATTTGILNATIVIADDMTLNVEMAAEDGTTKTYTLHIVIDENAKDLGYVKVNGNIIDKVDNKYTAIVTGDTFEAEAYTLNPNVKVKFDTDQSQVQYTSKNFEIQPGETKNISIIVIDANNNQETSTLSVSRKNTNTNIKYVILNDYDSMYDINNGFINEQVKANQNSVLTIEAENPNATIRLINGEQDVSNIGLLNTNVSITDVTTSMQIEVTAEDGITTQIYPLTVVLELDSVQLEYLKVDSEMVRSSNNEYSIAVAQAENYVIEAKAKNENATIRIDDNEAEIQTTTRAVLGNMEPNEIAEHTITVVNSKNIEATYTLKIRRKNNNVAISNIRVDETKASYNEVVGYSVTKSIQNQNMPIIINPVDTNATVTLKDGENVIATGKGTLNAITSITDTNTLQVEIVAEDGITTQTYPLAITIDPYTNKLKYLKLNGEELDCTDNQYAMEVTTENNILEVYTENLLGQIKIDEEEYQAVSISKEITINPLETKVIKITVKNQRDQEEEYTLTIRRKNNDVRLTEVKVNDIYESSYSEEKGYVNKEIILGAMNDVKITTNDSNATVTLKDGENVIATGLGTIETQVELVEDVTTLQIEVIAEDGTVHTYPFNLMIKSPNTNLEFVAVGDGSEMTNATRNEDAWNVSVNALDNYVIRIKTQDENATVKVLNVDEEISEGGLLEIQRTFNERENTIQIEVTAEDGTTKEYNVNIIIKNTETGIESVIVDGEGATYDEENSRFDIGLTWPNDNSTIVVTPVVEYETITISLDGHTATGTGMVEINLPITKPSITGTIHVVAESGDTKDYELQVRVLDSDTSLSLIEFTGQEYFDRIEDGKYELIISDTVRTVELVAEVNSPKAVLKTSTDAVYSTPRIVREFDVDDTEQIVVEVLAENGSRKQYIIDIIVETDLKIQQINVDDNLATKLGRTYKCWAERNETNPLSIVAQSNNIPMELIKNGEVILTGTGSINTTIRMAEETETYSVRLYGTENNSVTYKLQIVKKSANVNLEYVRVVNGDDVQEVEPVDRVYNFTLNGLADNVDLVVKAENEYATIRIDDDDEVLSSVRKTYILEPSTTKTIIITITSQSGLEEEYTVNIGIKSNDTRIKVLSVNGREAEYNPEIQTYTSMQSFVTEVGFLHVETNSDSAKVKIKGTITQNAGSILEEEIPLPDDTKSITLEVIAESGAKDEYILNIIKGSDDNLIKTVTVNNESVMESSDGNYRTTSEGKTFTITVTANSTDAMVKLGDTEYVKEMSTLNVTIPEGQRGITVPVIVRSQIGTLRISYIEIKGITSETSIRTFMVDEERLEPQMDDNSVYLKEVDKNETQHEVYIVAGNDASVITVNGETGTGNILTQVSMTEEEQLILPVTIQYGADIAEYTLKLVKLSDNTGIKQVIINDEVVDANTGNIFNKNYTEDITEARILIETQNIRAKISVEDNEAVYAVYQGARGLTTRETIIPFTVTSSDGNNISYYKIRIIKGMTFSDNTNIEYVKIGTAGSSELETLTIEDDGKYYKEFAKNYEREVYTVEVKAEDENAIVELKLRDVEDYSDLGVISKNINFVEDTLDITIVVTAEDGETKSETILSLDKGLYLTSQVYRIAPATYYDSTNKVNLFTDAEFARYDENDMYITGIEPLIDPKDTGTPISLLKENIKTNSNATVKVYNKKNQEITDETKLVGTEMTLEITKGDSTITLVLVVKGDVNGDGKLSGPDVSMLNKYALTGTTEHINTEARMLSIDVDLERSYNSSDLSKMRRAYSHGDHEIIKTTK